MDKYTTFIFDLDGTLLDSLEDLKDSVNYALRKNGFGEHTQSAIKSFVGNGVAKLVERALPKDTPENIFDVVLSDFKSYYVEHSCDYTKPYPGICEVLDELKRRGALVAVVSNKFDAATKQLCNHFFADRIDCAIGEGYGIRKKPFPDAINKAIDTLEADRSTAVYVGDSEVDIQAAQNSGLPCISVLWGFREYQFLKDNGGESFIDTPEELLRYCR